MTTQEILERLEEEYPEVLKADGFDEAIVGLAEGWFDQAKCSVLCYDFDSCIKILVVQGMSEEEAIEYLEFNTLGAYVGEYTPVFLHDWRSNVSPE